ncbi:hypothetical protein B6U74_02660 [Candidatus Bathyarchaeota archaeon ex4484_205]|nr:MAG: hypothetical protein B6U74_02660 [Candidatus Bathyarchaeota archaeon ex4484_205]
MADKILGRVVEGSVNEGIRIQLAEDEDIEDYPCGSLVSIEGVRGEYLGIITDAGIDVERSFLGKLPPLHGSELDRVMDVIKEWCRREWLEVALLAEKRGSAISVANTMPNFNSKLIPPTQQSLTDFFVGPTEMETTTYPVGEPYVPKAKAIEIPIAVDRLTELSFGIFGKSGTGKTFLGNILAGYLLRYALERDENLRLLIFDMHSEYGLELKDSYGRPLARGVGQIFRDYFDIYTPDLDEAQRRGLKPLKLNLNHITPSDIYVLAPIFQLTDTFLQHLKTIYSVIGKKVGLGEYWIWGLLYDSIDDDRFLTDEEKEDLKKKLISLAKKNFDDISSINDLGARIGGLFDTSIFSSYSSQRSKLRRLLEIPHTVELYGKKEDSIKEIVNKITSRSGSHVIISLGAYERNLPLYMSIANLLARQLRQTLLMKVQSGGEPETKIIIFLEEAHNFLGRGSYHLSPFGAIAREMRKRGVTLCVIDQKPGELDPDVVSMIWTFFTFTLTDRKDIDTAMVAISNPKLFSKIVPLLSKRDVLMYGEAVRFSVVVRVKDYKDVEKQLSEFVGRHRDEVAERERELRESGLL